MLKTRKLLLGMIFIYMTFIIVAILYSYQYTKSITFIQDSDVIVFWDPECSDCRNYVSKYLVPCLEKSNITDIRYVDILGQSGRSIYHDFLDKNTIPVDLQGKPTTSIKDRIILIGYVPIGKISELVNEQENITSKILLKCDENYVPERYEIWDLKSDSREYDIKVPVKEYLNMTKNNQGIKPSESTNYYALVPMVIAGGLIDGINPCAFAVILFLISYLYSAKTNPLEIKDVGLAYILTVFMAYFSIGLAIFGTIKFAGIQLYVMLASSLIIILLGVINIKDSFSRRKKPLLKIPEKSHKYISYISKKATIPAAIALALFVSITEFACTGAIYLLIISFLSSASTYFQGIVLLVIYNIMFIVPLIIIISIATMGKTISDLKHWREKEKNNMRLSLGMAMILLGIWTLSFRYSTVVLVITSMFLAVDLAFALLVCIKVRNYITRKRGRLKDNIYNTDINPRSHAKEKKERSRQTPRQETKL